jgi:transposase
MEVQFFMTKYTRSERCAAAQAVAAGEDELDIRMQYGISQDVLQRSIRLYREHGAAAFSRKYTAYSKEQKLQVLDYMHAHHLSAEETGIKFGIRGSATVWEWEQKYLEYGINGLEPKKKGRRPKRQRPKRPLTQVEQLLEENEYLRAENEYLKKLNALVAEREAREKHEKVTE